MVEFKRFDDTYINEAHELYNYYVSNTTVTYHIGYVHKDEFRDMVMVQDPYESYVIYKSGEFQGYVLFTKWKSRQAFDRTAEVTVYLKNSCVGYGIGTKAVNFIEERARKKGIKTLVSLISGDNKESIHLFEKLNYVKCAHFKNIGEKFGKLLDLICYEKEI